MIHSFSWRYSTLERRALQYKGFNAGCYWNKVCCASRQRRLTERLDRGCSCRRRSFTILAIGFDLQGESATKSAERQAASLLTDASSLLLFQPVLKAKPAQAFLKVLRSLQNKSVAELLTSYGDFFREMAASKSASWQDLLLDEILAGRDNAWAKAVARGEEAASLDIAVEHDLDVLQRLAVAESTLASWIAGSGSRVPEAWLKAASSIGPAAPELITHATPDTESEQSQGPCPETEADGYFGTPSASASDHILGPPTSEERRQWREKIAGEWKWSSAAPHVKQYFKRHGWGLMAAHSVLHWNNGAFQAASGLLPQHYGAGKLIPDSIIGAAATQLTARTDFHLSKGDATPLVLFHTSPEFPAVNQVERILLSLPLAALAAQGLRIVFASRKSMGEDIDDSQGLARGLTQHSRIRFLVVATGTSKAVSQHWLHHLGSWPRNAMLLWVENVRQEELDEELPRLLYLSSDKNPIWQRALSVEQMTLPDILL